METVDHDENFPRRLPSLVEKRLVTMELCNFEITGLLKLHSSASGSLLPKVPFRGPLSLSFDSGMQRGARWK